MTRDELEGLIRAVAGETYKQITALEARVAALEAAKPSPLDWPTLEPERLEKP